MRTLKVLASHFLLGVIVLTSVLLWCGYVAAQQLQDNSVATSVPSKSARLTSILPASQKVPEHTVYRIFFSHLETLDHVAEKLEAEGKNEDDLRTHEQRTAGLSKDEGIIMKQVAFDCNQVLRDQKAKQHAQLAARRARSAKGANASLPRSERRRAISERNEAVNAHVAQLRAMLGDASFEKLDAYVNSIIQPKVANARGVKLAVPVSVQKTLSVGKNGGAQ